MTAITIRLVEKEGGGGEGRKGGGRGIGRGGEGREEDCAHYTGIM